MPTDDELARSDVPPAAIRVALAVRAIQARGEDVSIERVMAVTGHGRTQVYEARAELRRRWPDEYRQSGNPESGEPDCPDIRKPAGQTPARRLDRAALILPGTAVEVAQPAMPANGVALWREALAEVVVPMDGQRSWDAYAIYSLAWDYVNERTELGEERVGNHVGLACDFVRAATGDPELVDRALVSMLVRQYGKAGLYGLSRAVGVTEAHTSRDWYRYARQVASATVAEL